MSDIETGGPAFPRDHAHDGHNGMTLRDYFAVHATMHDLAEQHVILRNQSGAGSLPDGYMVISRYMHADAMLAARKGGAA